MRKSRFRRRKVYRGWWRLYQLLMLLILFAGFVSRPFSCSLLLFISLLLLRPDSYSWPTKSNRIKVLLRILLHYETESTGTKEGWAQYYCT